MDDVRPCIQCVSRQYAIELEACRIRIATLSIANYSRFFKAQPPFFIPREQHTMSFWSNLIRTRGKNRGFAL